MTTQAADQAGFREVIRGNANVRRLWLGTIVSLFGDWFNTLALYRVTLELTGSELALGGIFLTKLLPLALASPIAGVLADRLDRRRLMIGADLARAVLVLGFLFVRDADHLWLLYTLAAAQIAVSAAFTPARDAVIPAITTGRERLTTNALLAATWSIMLAVGAAAGGPAVDLFGTDAVFVMDAATYLLSAWLIARITLPAREPQVSEGAVLRAAARQIAGGWQYIWTHPGVRRIATAKMAWGVGGGGLVLCLTLIGDRLFPDAGTTGIGVLFAARGIGTGVGPLLVRWAFRDASRWPLVLGGCVVAGGIGYVGIATLIGSAWAVAALVVFAHAGSGANWILSTTMLQERADDTMRGRVFATDWLLVSLVESASILLTSFFLERGLELQTVVLWLALVQVASGLVWIASVVPAERRGEG